jgi:hypothetical protein
MNITKETLLQHRANHIAQRSKHLADADVCEGAVRMIDMLLAELTKPEQLELPAPGSKPTAPDEDSARKEGAA